MPKPRTIRFSSDYEAVRAIGRAAYKLGLRYKSDDISLTGRPHFVFTSARTLIWATYCERTDHECRDGRWRPGHATSELEGRGLATVMAVQRSRGWVCEAITTCRSRDEAALEGLLREIKRRASSA